MQDESDPWTPLRILVDVYRTVLAQDIPRETLRSGEGRLVEIQHDVLDLHRAWVRRDGVLDDQPSLGDGPMAGDWRPLADALSDLVYGVDAGGCIVFANRAWHAVLGYAEADLAGLTLAALLAPENRTRGLAVFAAARETTTPHAIEGALLTASGKPVALRGSFVSWTPPEGQPADAVVWGVFAPPASGDGGAASTFHDPLTGLPNRALFLDRLAQTLSREAQPGRPTAVLFLNLDHFKVVNDSLGHEAGDLFLTTVADRLLDASRPMDTAARLGGDEFALALEGVDVATAVDVAEGLAARLRLPFAIGQHAVAAAASVGIALSEPGDQPGDLLRRADLALSAAKAAGGGRSVVFDITMEARMQVRFSLEADLRDGLARGEFEVYYQPIVHLDTSRIVAMEALVRWNHPVRGLLAPDLFIPLAEETGLIVPLGEWVLAQACQQGRLWEEEHPDAPPVMAVNVSMVQVERTDLAATVAAVLAESGLAPRLLELELTETGLMTEPASSTALVRSLRDAGVHVAVDDFGTGYSSLSMVRRLPVGTLKIDRSLVNNLDAEDAAIVRAVAMLGKTLGLRVTAEGVETAEQVDMLKALGCDYGQGWYFWRPRSAADAGLLLTDDLRALARQDKIISDDAAPV